jgi:hypothetical protein
LIDCPKDKSNEGNDADDDDNDNNDNEKVTTNLSLPIIMTV